MNVKISDYITDSKCTAGELNRVCELLNDGDTLSLGGVKLDITEKDIFKKHYFISNNDSGEKPIVFPIISKKNITIDGEGADLIFHGEILPFVIDNSENICIKNLSIDYANPFYAQAEIVESDENRVVLEFDGTNFACSVNENGELCFKATEDGWESITNTGLCIEFESDKRAPSSYLPSYFFYTGEKKDHGFLGYMYRDLKAKNIAENRIEFTGNFGFKHNVGNKWVCTYADRNCPGIFLNNSKDIIISNLNLYHTASMGVIGQLSENITLDRVVADVRKNSDRVLSVNADATHFSSCRGKIRIKDCKFVSMLDDACNIHGIYLKDPKKAGDNVFKATYGHPQLSGVNIFKEGDKVAIIDTETTKPLFTAKVKKSEVSKDGSEIVVTTYEDIPQIAEGYVAENLSIAPQIHISGTESGANRPRGFLLSSSGKTLVENCKFYNMYAAIHMGGEMLDWFESGKVKDVTIRNNIFDNSAYAGGYVISIFPKIKNRDMAGIFHEKIVIEDNHFRSHEKRFMLASNVGELIFRNNTYTEDKSLPSHPEKESNGIKIELCEKIIVEEPNVQ